MRQDGSHRSQAGESARFERASTERIAADAVQQAQQDPSALTLVTAGDRVAATSAGQLRLVPAAQAPAATAVLGTWNEAPLLLARADAGTDTESGFAPLRSVLEIASADTAEAATAAVALSRWHTDAAFCPACGDETALEAAGWARRCRGCSREHFPRTDPAIIVTVTDGERLLLGSNAAWADNHFSCFAGFVDAGESAEQAVRREVLEESGITVSAVTYFGSQGWPFPRSLMLGFHTRTESAADAIADGGEIRSVRWFTRDEILAGLDGSSDISLPGPSSISHRLIRSWAQA